MRKLAFISAAVVVVLAVIVAVVSANRKPIGLAVFVVGQTNGAAGQTVLILGITNSSWAKVRVFERSYLWETKGGTQSFVDPLQLQQTVLAPGACMSVLVDAPTNLPCRLMVPWTVGDFGSIPARWNSFATKRTGLPIFPGSEIQHAPSDWIQ